MFSLWYSSSFTQWDTLLAMLEMMADSTEVTVEWAEPAMRGDRFVSGPDGCVEWNTHTQRGSASRLRSWAERHVAFWQATAMVPLRVVRMEYKPGEVHAGW
jgi:hypothetical protein